jgi:hypothetical protein
MQAIVCARWIVVERSRTPDEIDALPISIARQSSSRGTRELAKSKRGIYPSKYRLA